MIRHYTSLSAAFFLLLATTAQAQPTMSVTRVAGGLSNPVYATTAPGDPNRLFVIEKDTRQIEIIDLTTGAQNGSPFLTVANVNTGGERGVLGLAFHPDYASNGRFFVHLTGNNGGRTEIREYDRQTADLADANSGSLLFTVPQPYTNHNGGWIGFGPNGNLHVGLGDGGSGNDPNNAGQDTSSPLGSILRIDVDGDDFPADSQRNYAIPAGNPFAGQTGAAPEILHYGIRNPWRASFDRETGDLYIGDVGQNRLEEIDVAPKDSSGINFGWRLREGTIATPSVGGNLPGAIDPIYDYSHGSGSNEGFSVTGGYVYRGPIEALQGHYFFADYARGRIWSLKWDGSDPTAADGTNYTGFTDWTDILTTNTGSIGNVSSFGEDEDGNLYIVHYANNGNGAVFKIDAATFTDCDFVAPNGCDVKDIDDLFTQFGGTTVEYDMNGDGSVNADDIATWLQQASEMGNHTYVVGDVDLNGSVNSTDLGALLLNFGDTTSTLWSRGNVNGDGIIDSTDLGLLLGNFAFSSVASAVPEPDFGVLPILVFLSLLTMSRKFTKTNR